MIIYRYQTPKGIQVQYGNRYRVREDPGYHGFWCVIDRTRMNEFSMIFSTHRFHWDTFVVSNYSKNLHWRSYDDSLKFVGLLEKAE